MPSESIVEDEAQDKPHWDQAELLETAHGSAGT